MPPGPAVTLAEGKAPSVPPAKLYSGDKVQLEPRWFSWNTVPYPKRPPSEAAPYRLPAIRVKPATGNSPSPLPVNECSMVKVCACAGGVAKTVSAIAVANVSTAAAGRLTPKIEYRWCRSEEH